MQNSKKLSFCIPVMNRLLDIKATLRKNLDDNAIDCNEIEFIVIVFDSSFDTYEWIIANYPDELKDGYLRVYHRPDDLTFWHFGKAKNAFKPYMKGRIYASLDGDNFTGRRGGNHIIKVFEDYDFNCIYHQFRGNWGDGTCGRISIVREDYVEIGYDENLLPRQWDELDLMLSTLIAKPERKYICYAGCNVTKVSFPFRDFLAENSIFPIIVEIPQDSFEKPHEKNRSIGQHTSSYVEKNIKLRLFSRYNSFASFLKNSRSFTLRKKYLNRLRNCQQEMLDSIPESVLENYCLDAQFNASMDCFREGIKLVACIKNEPLIHEWIRHYRSLGVKSFFLIDDESEVPLSTLLKDESDIFIWKPRVGSFQHAKTFWLEIILNLYCMDSWTYIVDGDEFAELPISDTAIANRTERFVENHEDVYFPGFLLDIFPSGMKAYKSFSCLDNKDFLYKSMTHYQYRPDNNYNQYKNYLALGMYDKYFTWTYRIDIRYRVNGSHDYLIKIPLVKWSKDMHLEQGFHKLTIGEKVTHTPESLSFKYLLPIRHFKYYKMFGLAADKSAEDFHAYYHRARINSQKLLKNFNAAVKFCAINPFTYEFVHAKLVPTPSRRQISIQDTYNGTSSSLQISDSNIDIFRFRQSYSDEIKIEDAEIYGPSLSMVLDWLKKSTPFQHQQYKGNGLYTLSCV